MRGCKIGKNKFGKINAVFNQQGEKSTLFQELLNVPSLTLKEAIDAYKNIYADIFKSPVDKKVEEYLNRISKIKEQDPDNYWSVDIPSEDVVRDAILNDRLVETKGGMAIVTQDGNMVGLFKDDAEAKSVAKILQEMRVEKGGFKMDNFDGYLTKIYQRNGFRVVSMLAFNEEFAPEGWNKEKHGTPDVVFMVYDKNNELNIEEKSFSKDQYEEAQAYRDSFEQEVKAIHPFYKNGLTINNTGKTQKFFSTVVEGTDSKYKSKKEWVSLLPFSTAELSFKNIYDKFKGNFDDHIATSIPTFRETQIKVGNAITEILSNKEEALVYDIGGSEGGFVKTITETSNGKIKSINLDVNESMQKAHETNPVEGSEFINEAFYEGYTDEDTGKAYKKHEPKNKADVVHESMVFQFITPERKQFIKEVKDKYLKKDGLLLLEEKLVPNTQQEWLNNEEKKDEYKRQFYSQEEISQKSEEILTGMLKNQTKESDLLASLKESFQYVEEYWDAGNFKGYLATNSLEKRDAFLNSLRGTITSEFSSINNKTQTNGINRLSQEEERGRDEAGRIAKESTKVAERSSRTSSKIEEKNDQVEALTEWAKSSGYWIEDYKNELGAFIDKGMESQVFYGKDDKVIKVNDLEFYDTPLAFLDSISLHNTLFPETTYKVIGFTEREDTKNFAIILEQPYIATEYGASTEEVRLEMEKRGFERKPNGVYITKDYIVEDLHEMNVLINEEGTLFFIDPVVRLNTPDNIYGGTRQVNEVQEPTLIEPSLNFNGYNSYKEAVQNTPIGEMIQIKVDDVVLAEVSSEGAINDLVRQNIIEGKRELQPNGDVVYKTSGTDLQSKIISGLIAKEVLGGKVNKAGDVRVEQKIEVEVSDNFKANKKELGESSALAVVASDILTNNTSTFGAGRIITEQFDIPSDNVLMNKLTNLLNQLGVKTMSLDAWKTRTGSDATPNALADIANRIVAFADGNFNEDTLSEETAHFIIEALDQEQIKPLLDIVHKTDEWKEYAQSYMEIYKDEAVVRKEILGKVLKNALQQRAQNTIQGQSIADRIVTFFTDFINKIRNILTDNHKQQLQDFTDSIYDKLIAEELINEMTPEQLDGNKLVLYQTQSTDTVLKSIEKLRDTLVMTDRRLSGTNQVTLSKIDPKELDFVSQLEAIAGLASVLKKQTHYLNTRGKNKGFLSVEEAFVYNLTEELAEVLKNVLPRLEDSTFTYYKDKKRKAVESAKDALAEVAVLEGNLNRERADKFTELVEDFAEQNNLTDQQKDILRKELESQDRDTRFFYSLFGGIIHAQNPVLNMLAKRVSRMNKESEVAFSQELHGLFKALNALGFKDEQVAGVFKKFAKGNHLLSAYDFDKYEQKVYELKLEAYKEVDPTSTITLEDISKNEEEWKLKLTQEQSSEYRYKVKEKIDQAEIRVDALSKENRKAYNDKIDALNLSLTTKKLLAEFKHRRSGIYKNAKLNGGYSEEDLQQLREITSDYQVASDIYEADGTVKKGLEVDDQGKVYAIVPKDQLSEDSRTALEFNEYRDALTELYAGSEKNIVSSFFNILQSKPINEREEFLLLNSRIFYTEAFWGTFDRNDTLMSKLEEESSDEALEVANQIKENNRKLKNILKRNKKYNQPSEIDFATMDGREQREVREYTTALETLYKQAKSFLTNEEKADFDRNYISGVNQSYLNKLGELGIISYETQNDFAERLNFIQQHTTDEGVRAISRFRDRLERAITSNFTNVHKSLEGYSEQEMLNEKNRLIIEYAETKLLPYFKSLQPKEGSVEDVIAEVLASNNLQEFEKALNNNEFVSITPAFIFEDADESSRLNPEFKRRLEQNEPLINDKFRNQEFFDYFGINSNIPFSVDTAVATKNTKEFEAWKLLLGFQEKAIDYANMTGKHNKYLLPQYRRGSFARIQQIATGLSLEKMKQGLKDAFTYREDNPELGVAEDGKVNQNYQKGQLTIPRTGFNQIKEEGEVTDELLYSYMLMMKEAVKYQKRTEAWSDVEAMEHFVKNKQYGDKYGEKTQTYKMFDSFVRYNIFGQTETFKWETNFFGLTSKKHNLAPVIMAFQNFVRNNNLAFSVLTPLTSFLQGSTNFIVENVLGDRINKDAARLASKEMPKLMTQASSEYFNVRGKSKLNKIFQYVGVGDSEQRFKNSDYGRALRGLSIEKSGYLTHFLADAPIQAQTVLTILHDYRIVGNEILDYNSWRKRKENRVLTEKDASVKWKNYEQDVIYKHLDESSDFIDVDQRVKSIEGWETKIQEIRDKITIAKQDIDNQISEGDKGAVQRNALFSWTTLHKGWLVTSLTKRFKGRHMNMFNNMMEEGTYTGTANFLGSLMKDIRGKGLKNAWNEQFKEYDGGYKIKNNIILDENGKVFKTFDSAEEAKDYYEELKFDFSRMRQIAVKRTFADLLVTTALAFMGLALSQLADDEDDDYVKEFVAYTGYRLATEVTSQSVGFPAQALAFIESPSVGVSQLQATLDVFDIFDDEEITRGTYRGYSKREAWFIKMTPGLKEANKIYNIDRTRNSFEFFNAKTMKFTIAGHMMTDDE